MSKFFCGLFLGLLISKPVLETCSDVVEKASIRTIHKLDEIGWFENNVIDKYMKEHPKQEG